MEYESTYNMPTFNDPIPCPNDECIDGMAPEYTTNDMGELEKEMVRCSVCKGDSVIPKEEL